LNKIEIYSSKMQVLCNMILIFGVLTPLSKIFQVYHDDQF
jgi:hypothetical protein